MGREKMLINKILNCHGHNNLIPDVFKEKLQT